MANWHDKFLKVTWSDFINLSFDLGQKIQRAANPDLIVAIARGGLTLSQLLSDQLSLPIASFTVQSYRDLKQVKKPDISFGVGGEIRGKKILLVDDVCDTGKTFVRGVAYLQELGAKKEDITTASLHHKPHAEYTPDFYVSKTDKWVIYPYEVRETITTLSSLWQKEGATNEEMKKRFLTFKIPDYLINAHITV